ncbi:MAG: hypothetical protein AAFV19_06730 [Pseudomonadota bacterium]
MAQQLTPDQQQELVMVAKRMAKRVMRDDGGDSTDKAAFRAYWQENKRHFITLSRVARVGYLGQR